MTQPNTSNVISIKSAQGGLTKDWPSEAWAVQLLRSLRPNNTPEMYRPYGVPENRSAREWLPPSSRMRVRTLKDRFLVGTALMDGVVGSTFVRGETMIERETSVLGAGPMVARVSDIRRFAGDWP